MTRAAGIALVVLATAAYFYRWDTVPSGYYTDAAVNVLNAICLQQTGADEYGYYLPTSIRAFDDYRPPLLIYLFAFSAFFHSLTVESARFMGMVLGWGGLALFFVACKRYFPLPTVRWTLFYPLLFAFTLLSSWVMVPHRMPVEFVTTLPVVLLLLVASWRWIEKPDSHRAALLAALATGLMLYAYYGTKLLAFSQVPLLGAVMLLRYRRLPKSTWSYLGVWGILALPTLVDLLGPQAGLARLRTVGSESPFDAVGVFFQHLGPDFLFLTGDRNYRHHTRMGGMLNIVLSPLALAGGLALLREVFRRGNTFWIFIALFWASALVPVSLTREGLPHALRTLPTLVPLLLVMILGFSALERLLEGRERVQKALFAVFIVAGCWQAYQNVHYYHNVTIWADRDIWTYFPGDSALPETPVDPSDHSAESINERYERVALHGDLRYCCAGEGAAD